jgi:Skp family chaperone for outer membrane proteins
MADEDAANGVRYTIREMFDRTEKKIDALSDQVAALGDKLDCKADDDALGTVTLRVVELEKKEEIRKAEAKVYREHAKGRSEWRRWAFDAAVTAAIAVCYLVTIHVF